MELWVLAAVLVTGLGLWSSLRQMSRPVRCRECGTTAEPMSRDLQGGFAPVVEIRYWCPRCVRVVARRCFTMAYE